MKIPHVCPQKFQISPVQSPLNCCPQIFPQQVQKSPKWGEIPKSGNTAKHSTSIREAMQFVLVCESRCILLAVAHGKCRLKQQKLNIFNTVFCRTSGGRERKKPKNPMQFSFSLAFSGKVESRLKCVCVGGKGINYCIFRLKLLTLKLKVHYSQ